MSYKLTQDQCKEVAARAVRALFEYCKANGIHYIVTGSSGGLDSAVTLGLAQRTCQMAEENGYKLVSVGLVLPCYTKSEETERGKKAIQVFGAEEISYDFSVALNFLQEDIDEINHRVKDILRRTNGAEELKEWENSIKIAQGNIKARLRMTFGTYHVARMMKGMVLSTDNLSEYWMAFWTLHGDVGDYGMVQNVLKGLELYDVARYLGVPQEIIDAKPDDGLGIGNGDADQLGAEYPIIDRIMVGLIQKGFDPDSPDWDTQLENTSEISEIEPEIIAKIALRALRGAYKRKGAIVLSRKDLGLPEIKDIIL